MECEKRDMFEFRPPNEKAERLIDILLESDIPIEIKDVNKSRDIGKVLKPVRDKKLVHISWDDKLRESTVYLKNKRVTKSKKHGKSVYIWEDTFIPNSVFDDLF